MSRNLERSVFCYLFIIILSGNIIGQVSHPRLFVTDTQKNDFLVRMKNSERVRSMVERTKSRVDPYVTRHQSDPGWIISRLQMYWNNKYTKVFVNGMYFSHAEGKAPVPTVRFSGSRDWATDYLVPSIEDVKPYMDDERGIYLQNNVKEGKPWEWAVPEKTGNIIERMNGNILDLAGDASFLYWLTQDEKYAVFASDIFMKYIEGMYYREPPLTEGNNGNANLMGLQTFEVIHERVIEPLTLSFDFLYQYLIKKGKNISMITDVFKKWADQEIKNGVPGNNWNLMQARYITYLALVMNDDNFYPDKKGSQYYIDQILYQNSIRQKALKDVALIFDQQTGIWPEASGYSMGVSKDILEICCLIDNVRNDHILNKFPIVEKAVLATFQYLFPNDYTVAFGDSHYNRLRVGGLEMLISQYRKYGEKDKELMLTAELNKFILRKEYDRNENQSLFQIFFNVDELASAPLISDKKSSLITNTFYAPNVSWFVQRNGMDREKGIMISENASLGNHSHTNGINVELYGKGIVFAPDNAAGISYWSKDHTEYYSRFPAHNTVIVDGKSDYANMGGRLAFNLLSNYPQAGKPGDLIGNVTFSSVSFTEPSTSSDQQRLLSTVRTGNSSAYIVDIFRSHRKDGNDVKNEYVYHSQGQKIEFYGAEGKKINLAPTDELSSIAGDLKGYDYFSEKQSVSFDGDFKSCFIIQTGDGQDVAVNFWMKGEKGRKIFSVMAPPSHAVSGSVTETLLNKPLPTLIVRQPGEAWRHPFVSVIEPYYRKETASVEKVDYLDTKPDGDLVGITVTSAANRKDYIFSASSEQGNYQSDNTDFSGALGVVGTVAGKPVSLFLGDGKMIRFGTWKVETGETHNPVSVTILNDGIIISSSKEFILTMPFSGDKAVLEVVINGSAKDYIGTIKKEKTGNLAVFELPAMDGTELSVRK